MFLLLNKYRLINLLGLVAVCLYGDLNKKLIVYLSFHGLVAICLYGDLNIIFA